MHSNAAVACMHMHFSKGAGFPFFWFAPDAPLLGVRVRGKGRRKKRETLT